MQHGDARVGKTARLFNIWRDILKRCNPNCNEHAIKQYAARGISVCEEWKDYPTFKVWALANGYRDDLSIERKDVNGNYEPKNCKWATRTEQARNRRTTRWIEHNGQKKSLAEWIEITGVTRSAFHSREARGWTATQALGLQPK